MTKAQKREHKIGNQKRKAEMLYLYYKVSPAAKGWIRLGCIVQDGKYTNR